MDLEQVVKGVETCALQLVTVLLPKVGQLYLGLFSKIQGC